MHHLSCLSVDKYYNIENIYLYMVECDENMTKSYQPRYTVLICVGSCNSSEIVMAQTRYGLVFP